MLEDEIEVIPISSKLIEEYPGAKVTNEGSLAISAALKALLQKREPLK